MVDQRKQLYFTSFYVSRWKAKVGEPQLLFHKPIRKWKIPFLLYQSVKKEVPFLCLRIKGKSNAKGLSLLFNDIGAYIPCILLGLSCHNICRFFSTLLSYSCFNKFLVDKCLFMGPLIPLFWTLVTWPAKILLVWPAWRLLAVFRQR